MLDERKKALISAIIEEYIKTAEPVGSEVIVDKYHFDLSPATIRHEMMGLDKTGYLRQPHHSAGRIPTEKSWQLYVENLKESVQNKKLVKKKGDLIKKACLGEKEKGVEELLKKVAKTLAFLSSNAAMIGFAPENVYYTGLSNLFSQPEFEDKELIYHISAIVDHLDEVMAKVFKEVDEEIKILVGRNNPFGVECGVILVQYRMTKNKVMFGLLGPIRQPYEDNFLLVRETQNLLANF